MNLSFKTTTFAFLTLILSLALTSCQKPVVKAQKSLEGEWDVVGIISTYGEVVTNGFISSYDVQETGALGEFNFQENTVTYSFTRNDTLYSGTTPWNVDHDKVNSGFVRVDQFTLTLDNEYVFDVAFGDQTNNAEKNATEVAFSEDPTALGWNVRIDLSLEKR